MTQTQPIMGMPITIDIADSHVSAHDFDTLFSYFRHVDEVFSTYKKDSEISRLNAGNLTKETVSGEVKEILQLAADTKSDTNGYFDIEKDGVIDPSGIVKGWAIFNAANQIEAHGYKNFLIDAGGDIQARGTNRNGKTWAVGIRNPFTEGEIVKVIEVANVGVATSGTYTRGQHIYNPHKKNQEITDIASITVIGSNIYDADRFATAAFAMGKQGIHFIETLEGFEGYMIDREGIATETSGFGRYVVTI